MEKLIITFDPTRKPLSCGDINFLRRLDRQEFSGNDQQAMTGDKERKPELPPGQQPELPSEEEQQHADEADRRRDQEEWERRVGSRLKKRRAEIDTAYRVRRDFAKAVKIPDKTIQELETGYRTNFSDPLKAAAEKAYRWAPGSIDRCWAGGEPEPYDLPSMPVPDEVTVDTAWPGPGGPDIYWIPKVDIPSNIDPGQLTDWEKHLWYSPGLTVAERRSAVAHIWYLREQRTREQPDD